MSSVDRVSAGLPPRQIERITDLDDPRRVARPVARVAPGQAREVALRVGLLAHASDLRSITKR